jgi:hypothetical protein
MQYGALCRVHGSAQAALVFLAEVERQSDCLEQLIFYSVRFHDCCA